MSEKGRMALTAVAERLRAIAMAKADGELLGSEDTTVQQLGASRSTVRQAARLLEREGILRVRRGPAGGYFASRPSPEVIQETLGTYLQTIDFDPHEITLIASALWIELVRVAARRIAPDEPALPDLMKRIAALTETATFARVRALEEEARNVIFGIAECRYIELIFRSNIVFANRAFAAPSEQDGTPEHRRFVPAWRDAKGLELSAIRSGQEDVAALAARHARRLWHERVWLNRPQAG